uniref:Fic family protein n=1 Tax=uncultured Thiotrichaceae bacterium TaxID=298394 RepID=A0A6S6UC94_9GAMM|nr:MAG: Fic family protein [uncultured Thiotrichaceae bacterium]
MDLRTLNITPDLLSLIAEIDEFKGSWRLLKTLNPERLERLRYVATIESIGSSTRIEGSKLSDSEIEQLLGSVNDQSFSTRDEQEVAGYAEVMDVVFQNYSSIPFSENYIKQLHGMLLRHSNKDQRHAGAYKTLANNIEAFHADGSSAGIIFETTSPFDTPQEMQDLIVWTRETLEDKAWHPLIVVGIFKVVFLAIHPFQDGNGRLSRVLTSLLLLKVGYNYIPYSSLESIIENNKDAYYLNLRRTQQTLKQDAPDWCPWLRFFLNTMKRQKDHLATKTEVTQQYEGMTLESIQIMEYLNEHRRITTKMAVEITGAARPTVKNRLGSLVAGGYLVMHGKGRGTWYERT